MKIKNLIYGLVISSVVLSNNSLSVNAEDAVPISITETTSVSETFSENSLETPISPGIRVISYERPMILTGASGETIRFTAEAFNDHGGYVPSSVKILSLPDETAGSLVYNSKPVSVGQSISVLTLNSLYYKSIGSDDAEFTLSTDNSNVIRCLIRHKDSENNAPLKSSGSTVSAYTKVNAAVAGYLDGYDPDGDQLRFEIVSYPVKGIVSVSNKETGHFVYHPYEGISGEDTFTYRICDSFGKYSEVCSVSISIDRSYSNIYDDMNDSYYTSAVTDAVKSGIMQTRKTAEGEFFDPSEPVSRIDFLIMAMRSMGAGEGVEVSDTPFEDDSTLTNKEKGYLSAAYRLGIVKGTVENGSLKFMPDEGITGASAAVILNSILGLPENDSISVSAMDDGTPAWAAASMSALAGEGIIDKYTTPADSVLSRENVAVILSRLMHELA